MKITVKKFDIIRVVTTIKKEITVNRKSGSHTRWINTKRDKPVVEIDFVAEIDANLVVEGTYIDQDTRGNTIAFYATSKDTIINISRYVSEFWVPSRLLLVSVPHTEYVEIK